MIRMCLDVKRIKDFIYFLKDTWRSRSLIWKLAKSDLKKRYAGAAFGTVWAYVQPLVSLLVFWFVFQVGFRNAPVDDVPFILWLSPAFILWNFFSDALNASTNTLPEYNYLVKKMKFRTSILPLVKITSSFLVHLFFVVVVIVMCLIYQYYPTWMWFQVIYYLIATLYLLVGLGWVCSSISVFFKDFGPLVGIFLQIGFWLVPVFWNTNMMQNQTVLTIMKLNPCFYLVQGYRDSFVYNIGFWNYPNQTLYFWIVSSIIFVLGAVIFRKLKPHFADVL